MLQTFLVLALFVFIFVAVVVLVVIHFVYRGIRRLREAREEEFYRQEWQKEQKERNPFDKDYFKSAGSNATQGRSAGSRQSGRQTETKNTATDRKTTAGSGGVTVIDDRDAEDRRKIFDHQDGDYVEFEEV